MIPLARPHPQANYFAPEVVQTSMMDCGPATLQSLVQGFGLSVNYGRLREACQTGVDGTSISTMDEIANFLGLDTEEMMLPVDHLLLPDARALPAIVVSNTPTGVHHFVVVWSIAGPLVQVMDPAQGRAWIPRGTLFEKLYNHRMRVPASTWRAWVGESEFLAVLDVRLTALEIERADRERLTAAALADPGWRAMSALDAATRMCTTLTKHGAVMRGADCLSLIERQTERDDDGEYPLLLADYRSAQATPPLDDDPEEMLTVKGVVLMRARGRRSDPALPAPPAGDPGDLGDTAGEDDEPVKIGPPSGLPPELASALRDTQERPMQTLFRLLRDDGLTAPLVLTGLFMFAAVLTTLEAIVLRGLLEVGSQLGLASQRAAAIAGVVAFMALGIAVELPLASGVARLGRMIDVRLRLAFLSKLPRLDDRYFRSRLPSDMAERGHSAHMVRALPQIGMHLIASSVQMLLTVAGIAWLEPAAAPAALVAAVFAIGLPLVLQPLLGERELRMRGHSAALGRFYLDALLGLVPIRVHGAQAAIQHQQEVMLVHWSRSGLRFHASATFIEGALALSGALMAIVMVWSVSGHSTAGLLLLVYWALNLPQLGQDIAGAARQYPAIRNVIIRLIEPLSAPEPEAPEAPHAPHGASSAPASERAGGVAIELTSASVEAAGNTVLDHIDLAISPGEHIAIIGPSGAGKSSLVGLLLGWAAPSTGSALVDGRPIIGESLRALRRETAWVDPAVQLWNRSFLDNLRYGAPGTSDLPLAEILANAQLREVLEHLPDGLATELGEGGSMVSGGEGQRTRVGRALARKHARLVILDEPFRGLDRTARRALLTMARRWWQPATMLWVTHDISETEAFDRVLVIDGGRIVEDGHPTELLARAGSRYGVLARGDREMHASEWAGPQWRRVWIQRGKAHEEDVGS